MSKVKRYIFGVENGKVVVYEYELEWRCLIKSVTIEYVYEMCSYVRDKLSMQMVLDATTANVTEEHGWILSPHIMKYPGSGLAIREYYNRNCRNCLTYEQGMAVVRFYYMFAVYHTPDCFKLFKNYRYYTDVFWHPNQNKWTQAELLATMRVIYENGLLDELLGCRSCLIKFVDWYYDYKKKNNYVGS